MKDSIKREQYKTSFLYGIIFLFMGIIGMVFPQSAEFIITFCFISGGSVTLTAALYFFTHKVESKRK